MSFKSFNDGLMHSLEVPLEVPMSTNKNNNKDITSSTQDSLKTLLLVVSDTNRKCF